jgi:hypothetical protein
VLPSTARTTTPAPQGPGGPSRPRRPTRGPSGSGCISTSPRRSPSPARPHAWSVTATRSLQILADGHERNPEPLGKLGHADAAGVLEEPHDLMVTIAFSAARHRVTSRGCVREPHFGNANGVLRARNGTEQMALGHLLIESLALSLDDFCAKATGTGQLRWARPARPPPWWLRSWSSRWKTSSSRTSSSSGPPPYSRPGARRRGGTAWSSASPCPRGPAASPARPSGDAAGTPPDGPAARAAGNSTVRSWRITSWVGA